MPGLRERKKRQTRDAIVRAALQLFRERGYDATTVADIAAAADIAPRTFFAYFETKEAVVFYDFDEILARFAERLDGRAASETTFDALRAWAADLVAAGHEDHARRDLIRSTPSLQVRQHANH